MSFDIFLQCMRNGNVATFNRSIFEELFGAYVVARRPGFMRVDFNHIPETPSPVEESDNVCRIVDLTKIDGGEIYVDDSDEIDGGMFNHCGGDRFWQALYELARRTGSVIYWPAEGPASAVADEAIIGHMPADMIKVVGPVQIVGSGSELAEYIADHS